MNRKEVNEIKKNFTDKSGFFTMDRILTGFIDADKNVLYHAVQPCVTMPIEFKEVCDMTLIKVLSTQVGKKFTEYEFPNSAYDTGHVQPLLYSLLNTELKDNDVCMEFLKHIANNIVYTGPFAVITAYCTYTIRKKNKTDEFDDFDNEELYRYVLTAICPADTGTDGFVFDKEDKEILKKLNDELIIDKVPTDGFLFPVFDNRSSDINHVMIYSKSTKSPNVSLVEDVLECEFVMSPDVEKESFRSIIKSVAGDDLDYTMLNTVNEKIKDVIDESSNDTEVTLLGPTVLKDILRDTGLDESKVNSVDAVYRHTCGDSIITAANVVEHKNTVQAPGIKIDISSGFSDKLRTSVVDGRRCILIDLDDPTVEVNGLPITLQ